ncbi:MAG: hypothetical protein IJN53_06660 [Oscillospiraceae bacterium]|nr:hypothetical protein [Oscillospiraceae bacterium]
MRKSLYIFLIFFLAGCQKISLPELPAAMPPAQTAQPWQAQNYADTAECSFTLDTLGQNAAGDWEARVLCCNKSGQKLMFTVEDLCLQGWQLLPFWSESLDPGQAGEFVLRLERGTLEKCGISQPKAGEFRLRVFSQEDLHRGYLVDRQCAFSLPGEKTPQSAPLVYPQDAMVLFDNNGCALAVTQLYRQGDQLYMECLIENKTRENLHLRAGSIRVNGLPLGQALAGRLSPGAKAYQSFSLELPAEAGVPRRLQLHWEAAAEGWQGRVWVQEMFSLPIFPEQ